MYRLARLEIRVIKEEAERRQARLGEVVRLLGSRRAILGLVRKELAAIRDDARETHPRHTGFVDPADRGSFSEEDFILAEGSGGPADP